MTTALPRALPNLKDGNVSAQHQHEIAEHSGEAEVTSILILYATETGTALDIAEQLAREARRRQYDVRLASIDAYPIEDLVHEILVLFVVSTTGSGIPPRSMTTFWTHLLRADLPLDILDELHFSIFGLGDSAYERFCWAAKMLRRRLAALGAVEIAGMGLGDEQAPLGAEAAFDDWMPVVFEALEHVTLKPAGKLEDVNALPLPRIRFINTKVPTGDKGRSEPEQVFISNVNMADVRHSVTVKCNQRMTAEDWFQDVRHIELELEEKIPYEPGDVAVIYPKAADADVIALLKTCDWLDAADEPVCFEVPDPIWICPTTIPMRTTLRDLFTSHLDINAVPRRSFFRIIRHFAHDETERDKLEEFCVQEGAEDLYDYTTRVRRTIREVLTEFRSVIIPKEYIFDVFPLLKPRQFSIASSSEVHPKDIHICVAIVKYKTKLKATRKGTCSTYLAKLAHGSKLYIGIQKGFLSVPDNPRIPIVCVGPGTGIAPMRSVLEHRVHRKAIDNTLYFGCRSEAKDHHYGSEWRSLSGSQKLNYRVAFSRDGPEGVKRKYVQDLMAEDAVMLWDLVGKRGGWIYISGSSNKMPAAVKGAIQDAARTAGGLSEEDAKVFLKGLQEDGRLYEECWS